MKHALLISVVVLGWSFTLAPQYVLAESLLPGETDIQHAINHYITQRLEREAIQQAVSLDDAAFLRRVTLDLAGRIPTRQELGDFLALPESERRETVIAGLLNQPDFAFHHANEIDLMLLARIRKDNEWRAFLLEGARENRSWAELFKQVIIPDVERSGEVGPAAFLRERVRELDDLTNDTAVLFFGVNIGCAKCHDHPLVDEWKQDHYFGMASFFKRTYQTKSRTLAEHFEGDVKFTNILGEEKRAAFMFLSNTAATEPEQTLADDEKKKLEEAIKQAKNDDKATPPTVAFSPRAELIRLALEDEEKDFFARNIVNRIWARLLGRGLVMPLDQMHADNPASHPELMDWLVRDLKTHHYDLRRLIAGIVRSDVYARSCRWEAGTSLPSPETFALGEVRPLTPRQLSLSLLIATANQERLPGIDKPEDWEKQRTDLENRSNGFADLFPIPDEGFQVGTDEALLFSNSPRFQGDFLRSGDDRLIGQLLKISAPDELVTTLFESVFTRRPNPEELEQFVAFLTARDAQREAAVQYLTWALLASSEFRFNH